jgi:hypothetical protein
MVEAAEKHEEHSSKLKVVSDQRDSIKQFQIEISNVHIISSETKLNL